MEKQNRFLLIPLGLFLICFLWIGYYNRFASDDFEFLNKLRTYGFAGSVQWFHEHWNTRWSAITLLNWVLICTLTVGSLVWYHLVSFLLLWWAFYRNISNLIHEPETTRIIYSGYASIAFFYACFSINDVFFWINTSTMYLYGCIAIVFAIAEITTRKHTVLSYLRLSLLGLFTAGAYEPLVFTCMLSCVAILFLLVKRHKWDVWRIPFDKKIIILLSSLMLGFAISYSGEGHVVRATYLPQESFFFKTWVWIKAIVKMFVLHIPLKMLPVFLFSIPWFLFGAKYQSQWFSKKLFQRITIVMVVLVMISLLPVAFIMSEMGPERAWTQISLYLVVYIALVACYAGKALQKYYSMNKVLKLYSVIAVMYVLAIGIPRLVQAKQYSNAYDERIALILDHKNSGKNTTLTLSPLPESGWLHSAEIATGPEHFYNIFLKEFLGLDFEIISNPPVKAKD